MALMDAGLSPAMEPFSKGCMIAAKGVVAIGSDDESFPTNRRLAAILAADIAGYSRLMGTDEEGTLARLKILRKTVVDPKIKEHRGRIVKTTGDGMLVEFASVVDAVRCAVEVQRHTADHNAEVPPERRIEFRVGINVGDIIIDGDDIFGDGVNVAARLEALAEPGGICVSRVVRDQVRDKLSFGFDDLGDREVKNIARPVHVFRVRPRGELDGVPAPSTGASGPARLRNADAVGMNQEIGFCRTPKGVRLAYAKVGLGPPLVKTANWMNHLEYDWESPIWRHLLRGLSRNNTLIRYDARGNGLSDWDVDEISFEAFVRDLETVVDAIGLERFPLLGISQGCAVSIAYAVRHPERVSQLILYGGFALGPLKRSPAETEQALAMMTLMRQGWGTENPAFRQMFTSLFIPEGTKEQFEWFNELQRIAISPENAFRVRKAVGDIDVRDLLPKVRVPTLVIHARGDAVVPLELGRTMASEIPGARFVVLQSRNHLILEKEPASDRFLEEVNLFLTQGRVAT